MTVSGKSVIIAILSVALIAAGTSWWFRFNATHQTAGFWGPHATQLIRDAPTVDLAELGEGESAAGFGYFDFSSGKLNVTRHFDISHARGLVHLRNALLEDRSYQWPARNANDEPKWKWILGFRDEKETKRVFITLTEDCSELSMYDSAHGKILSSEPISSGLGEMFAEITAAGK